jgi:hypothetical protein
MWGLIGLSDLQHRIFTIDSLSLTLFAQIVVVANGTLIPYACYRCRTAAVTGYAIVYLSLLASTLYVQILAEKALEARVAEVTNFFLNKLNNLVKSFHREDS